jgi:hypothetical protein
MPGFRERRIWIEEDELRPNLVPGDGLFDQASVTARS